MYKIFNNIYFSKKEWTNFIIYKISPFFFILNIQNKTDFMALVYEATFSYPVFLLNPTL